MGSAITVLNFDQTYYQQFIAEKENCDWIDLRERQGTNLLCEQETLRNIGQRLGNCCANPITMLGSGNYHYVSYLLLSQIQTPFTLILFDHHTDMLPSPSESLISCGSWVYASLQKLPFLKKVILIGVGDNWEQYVPTTIADKVTVFPEQFLHQADSTLIPSILSEIPTSTVYFSIDKDVLDEQDAITAWDHGTLRLQQLMEIIQVTADQQHVRGIDICGEYPVTPANAYQQLTKDAIRKNNYANSFVLEQMNATVSSS